MVTVPAFERNYNEKNIELSNLPDYLPFIKLVICVLIIEELETNHSKDIDNDDEDQCKVT